MSTEGRSRISFGFHVGGCGQGGLTAEASIYRRLADKGSYAANWALSVEGDHDRAKELSHWNARYWAMESLAYLAAADELVAVLGATYYASIPHRGDGQDDERYLHEVVERQRAAD